MDVKIDAVIVAAGSGTRLGFEIPKAFVPLNNRPLLSYSLDIFLSHRLIDKVILVIPQSMQDEATTRFCNPKIDIVTGGNERWKSVYNGVKHSCAEWILVHDAARPFVDNSVIDSLLEKREEYQCAITVTPVVDTIRTFKDDLAGATVDRDTLIRVGTPQLFKRSLLSDVLVNVKQEDPIPTDEAILMQNAGIPVAISWGNPNNFKITTRADLELAEALLKSKK